MTTSWVRPRIPFRWTRIVIYAILLSFVIFYLMPVYILVVTSFKTYAEVSRGSMWFPSPHMTFQSFIDAWFGSLKNPGLNGNFLNSVLLTVPAMLISSWLGSLNGYILSKWKFRGANILFPLLLFGMFIPYQSVLIPLVVVFREIHRLTGIQLYGNLWGLIVAHTIYGIPITTLIFRNYYASIPTEMIEAARIDGAGFFGILWHIMWPLSAPGFVVTAIWQFTSIWNDYLFAITLTDNPIVQPVTIGLVNLAASYSVEWNVQMAGALMTAFPPLLVYILLGRFFMRGLMAGSLKG